MKIANVVAMALIAACTKPSQQNATQDWQVSARVALPTGAALMPTNPSQPGIPVPQGIVWNNGSVYVTLSNLLNYQPAGPSFVAQYDDTTLVSQSLLPLTDGTAQCTNAGAIRLSGTTLLVACAGFVSLDPNTPANQGVLAELSISPLAVTQLITTGGSPGSVLQIGSDIWMGDLETPNVLHVGGNPSTVCASGYVSDLAEINGRAFASCFNDNTVQEFDPSSGATIGAPLSMGDGPVHMTTLSDRIAVVDSLSGTISFVFPTTPATATREAVLVAGQQGGDDVEGIAFDGRYVAAADSGFGTLVLFDTTKNFQLVDAVDMKDTPTSPTNDPYGVAAGGGAFFVAIEGWTQPGELVRVTPVSK